MLRDFISISDQLDYNAIHTKRNSATGVSMILHVLDAKYLNEYRVWISFNNGNSGIINLKDDLDGEMFEVFIVV